MNHWLCTGAAMLPLALESCSFPDIVGENVMLCVKKLKLGSYCTFSRIMTQSYLRFHQGLVAEVLDGSRVAAT